MGQPLPLLVGFATRGAFRRNPFEMHGEQLPALDAADKTFDFLRSDELLYCSHCKPPLVIGLFSSLNLSTPYHVPFHRPV